MKNETSQIEQRVKRYWYSDGIGELMGGGMFFLLGAYFSLQQYVSDQSFVGGLLQTGFVVILISGIFVTRRLINALKERVTYPRTGYIEYRTSNKNANLMRALTFVVAMIVAAVSLFVVRGFDTIDAMVAVTGLLVAVIFAVKQGLTTGIGRFYFFSAASLVLGGVLSVSGFARGYNLGLFYGLMGIAFVVSGGLTLKRYLSENPMPTEAVNER
jgi:predicted membrane protein